jgi:hypothetical protein
MHFVCCICVLSTIICNEYVVMIQQDERDFYSEPDKIHHIYNILNVHSAFTCTLIISEHCIHQTAHDQSD